MPEGETGSGGGGGEGSECMIGAPLIRHTLDIRHTHAMQHPVWLHSQQQGTVIICLGVY